MNIAIISENIIYCIALEHLISGLSASYKCNTFSSLNKMKKYEESNSCHFNCILISQNLFFTDICVVCKLMDTSERSDNSRFIVLGHDAEKINVSPEIMLLNISGSVDSIRTKLRHMITNLRLKKAKPGIIVSPLPPLSSINGGVIKRIYSGDDTRKIAAEFRLSPKTISGMNIRMLKQLGIKKVDFKMYFDGGIPPCLFRKESSAMGNDLIKMAVYKMIWKCKDKVPK